MSPTEPEGIPAPSTPRRRRTVRLRTLLIWLAVVPTAAMGTQTVVTAERLLAQSEHLRADVEAGERLGEPLIALVAELQAERTTTAAAWAGPSVPAGVLHDRLTATDRAAAEFRRLSAGHQAGHHGGSEHSDQRLGEVTDALDGLTVYRARAESRSGDPEKVIGYYTDLVDRLIRLCQDAFSHPEDAGLTAESRPVVAMLSASEMVAREDTLLALAGPSRELTQSGFAAFLDAIGAHRYLYDTAIVPYLPAGEGESYQRITRSDAWQAKLRIEDAILSDHKDVAAGVRLPAEVAGWPVAHGKFAAQLRDLTAVRSQAVLKRADTKGAALESQVLWLVGGSGSALLVVVLVVVLATRSMLRRLDGLHRRTVAVAERTLPDVVARLDRGQTVDESALPKVGGYEDEVGRISDAFARVVAVSVDGHRRLAAERHGFGMFASGIASRTGNLVSRQLGLTEDIQDAFGHNEALLAQLMRSDQLTVGMRRQIENLLILSGGEIPDPHTEPMRVADLLREAAAEVEDFRRIERQALDEASVEPQVISQISHLLAELLDNAARFSPPRSKVVIRAELVADGLSVEIEDRGPRVTSAGYEEMNRRLHTAPPYAVLAENAHRLGLFVVGHLADQLGAAVTLRRSVYGGTSAVVILPGELLVEAGTREPERRPEREPVSEPAAAEPAAAELVLHTGSRLPARRPEPVAAEKRTPALRPAPRGGDARPSLPERVPQTHMTEQLRGPRAPEPALGPDTATPEEVADAWADYEQGTQTVEAELRREQP